MHFTLVLLPLLVSVNAAISVLYPRTGDIWYKNNTVALNWTQSDPATDTYTFRAVLSNEDSSVLSQPQQIAQETNASATYVRLGLPNVAAAQGYIVSLVNTTNETQVFARSEAFEIQEGNRTTASSSALPSSSASRSGGGIPNAGSSQAAFPTASVATSSGAASPASIMPSFNLIGQAIAFVGLAAGAAAALL